MESLPRELLIEITKKLPLSAASRLAQTSQNFNRSIWSCIRVLDEKDSRNFPENIQLEQFRNLETLEYHYECHVIPLDLSKLTTLQVLSINFWGDRHNEESITVLKSLTNLREISLKYKSGFKFTKTDDLLANHTRMTYLYMIAENIMNIDLLSSNFMTRLRYLKLAEINWDTHYYSEDIRRLWTFTQLRGLELNSLELKQNVIETGLSKLINVEEFEVYGCKKISQDGNTSWLMDYNELLDLKKLTYLSMISVDLDSNLIDIITSMTQLRQLYLFEIDGEYEISPFSTLQKLNWIWFGLDITPTDLGLEFSQLPNLEIVSIPWCPNVTQLVHLKKLKKLYLRPGNSSDYPDPINFLSGCVTLREVFISADILTHQNTINLTGLTALTEIELFVKTRNKSTSFDALAGFVRSLSTLPGLSVLKFDQNFIIELMPIITTSLKQLSVLTLPIDQEEFFIKRDPDPEAAKRDDLTSKPSYSLDEFDFKIKFKY